MEPHRSYPGDGEQRWYDGQDWDRGRHGAQAPPVSGPGYRGAEEEYTGRGVTDSGVGDVPAARLGDTDPGDSSRRSAEPIDVGALRRPPVSSPPADYPPVYGAPPDQPLYPAQGYGGTSAPTSGYGGNPAASDYGANPLSAPTAAVNTLPPTGPPPPVPPSAVPQVHHSNASIYHSRKPAVMIVLAAVTVLLEIPALRLLTSAAIEDVVSVSGVVAGTFLVAGIPVFAYGLYGLLGGATVNTNPATWLKAPLVYVPLGVLLLLLAALAAA